MKEKNLVKNVCQEKKSKNEKGIGKILTGVKEGEVMFNDSYG